MDGFGISDEVMMVLRALDSAVRLYAEERRSIAASATTKGGEGRTRPQLRLIFIT